MLMNPYQVVQKKVIAQSSRKTDIYAFALLSWEVLTQNQAFFDVDTEGELCAKVHKGQRPPLEQIPRNCPSGVINCVKACWDTNRHRRKTAIECLAIYQFFYGIVGKKKFDIFFSHNPTKSPISIFVLQVFSQRKFLISHHFDAMYLHEYYCSISFDWVIEYGSIKVRFTLISS